MSEKKEKKLTHKQARFCDEYMIDLNATKAAIRAGYSEKTAQEIGAQNLSKIMIKKELEKRQLEIKNELQITQERVLSEIASIAFANASDFMRIDKDGVRVIPTYEMDKDKLPALASIKQGNKGVEVKMHDKIKALDLLGKRLGLWENQDNNEEVLSKLDDVLSRIADE